MKRLIPFLLLLTVSTGSSVAAAQDKAEKLGKVHFPVSCTPAAQQQFDRAVSMLHSFWYPQGLKAFEEVTKTDPNCAMAYWAHPTAPLSRMAWTRLLRPKPPVPKRNGSAITSQRLRCTTRIGKSATTAYASSRMKMPCRRCTRTIRKIPRQETQTAASANPTGAVLAGYTAYSAIPARYAIERGAWAEAAALEPHPSTPVADAITYFARGMGAARGGDVGNARKEIARLQGIKQALAESKQDYWAEQTDIQITAVSAWVAYAEGKKTEGLKLMRSAADREDGSEKHVAMENRLWPMREILGDLLLAMHQPAQALKEYETSLEAARNRYRGFYGAAKAAQQAGDREKAKGYYEKLLALCTHGGVERRELAEAKTYLAQR